MFDLIANFLSFFIRPIYAIVGNYGWTIIIFTILLKLVTMPFTVKSQKSMARMQQVQPLISEIQRKYANNREKQQQELDKEKKMQQAIIDIQKKFGKNAVIKGMNFEEGAMTKERNKQIGGHKA